MTESTVGPLIATGRSADIFDIGLGRVLRRYRDGRPAEWASREAEVITHARAHGVPVPEVFDVAGPDIVMERVTGRTMLDVLAARPWLLWSHVGLLARLHEQVHAVPPLPWLRAPFGTVPDPVLVHLDLHPLNVILTAAGPMLIDWEGAAQGPPEADIAMTWVLMGFADIPGSRVQAAAGRLLQGLITRAFARAAGGIGTEWRAAALRAKLSDPHMNDAEAARMRRALGRLTGAAHQTAPG